MKKFTLEDMMTVIKSLENSGLSKDKIIRCLANMVMILLDRYNICCEEQLKNVNNVLEVALAYEKYYQNENTTTSQTNI
jgi:nitrate reductase NapAB chaperone NapD